MDFVASVERDGFAVVPNAISGEKANALVCALLEVRESGAHRRGGDAYALRNLLRVVPEARQLADSAVIRSLVEPLLGQNAFAVRSLLFDKTPAANWKVSWHQDFTIAVKRRAEVPGFGAWSVKEGVSHVQPPVQLLERMLSLRLHLDDCDEDNGPLRVLPGSHRHGRLNADAIREWRAKVSPVSCTVKRGSAVLMRPLLLHASSSALRPGHRRVIHIEFAAEELPGGLRWFM